MNPMSREDAYRKFCELITQTDRTERSTVQTRMRWVLLWSVVIPIGMAATALFLLSVKVLPLWMSGWISWVFVALPVGYLLFFVLSEARRDYRFLLSKGTGLALSLKQFEADMHWRQKFILQIKKDIPAQHLPALTAEFEKDLLHFEARAKHVTGISGAVFFMIMQGLDYLGGGETDQALAAVGVAQYLGLALFLVLFYLAQLQTLRALKRYWDALDLSSRWQ